MYPLKLESIYYDKIWGGRDLTLFRDNLPEGDIGESWDVACHPHGTGIVANGIYKGKKLDQLIEERGEALLGSKISKDHFPLLVKLINAKEKLSVQVHPNDAYGFKHQGEPGKTEIWYVVEAFDNANLIIGTNNCTKEEFATAIEEGNTEKYLNAIPVKKGEVYFIKSGMVHAIGEGVIIAEIQQNSDTTYRVFDYDRGRELHVDKALDVIDFNLKGERRKGLTVKCQGYTKTYYALCEYFSLEEYDITDTVKETSDVERFYIFTCVEGEGEFLYEKGKEHISKGESLLIPASLGEYSLTGNMKVLKSYVPDEDKVKSEILNLIL
ncbi:type I phosphomannose isomerase catalytic subunit [Clostridium polynesiense]|uniref:type I phosphomannose isomerase catalytic subunit n=1 Tax=Clostridium polynesiense TaxID=1325933 RepID=UPI000590E8DC|nr:type I phosphomannose isomerase catalytic subunit [Clostridium polynesiense]